MAEVIARDTCANAIERVHAFATDDNFAGRLNREIRTRLDHLHAQWERMQKAYVILLSKLEEDDDQRGNHLQILAKVEELFLDADSTMQERLHEMNAPADEAADNCDSESEHSKQSDAERQHDNDNHSPAPQQASTAMQQPPVQIGPFNVAAQQPNQYLQKSRSHSRGKIPNPSSCIKG